MFMLLLDCKASCATQASARRRNSAGIAFSALRFIGVQLTAWLLATGWVVATGWVRAPSRVCIPSCCRGCLLAAGSSSVLCIACPGHELLEAASCAALQPGARLSPESGPVVFSCIVLGMYEMQLCANSSCSFINCNVVWGRVWAVRQSCPLAVVGFGVCCWPGQVLDMVHQQPMLPFSVKCLKPILRMSAASS